MSGPAVGPGEPGALQRGLTIAGFAHGKGSHYLNVSQEAVTEKQALLEELQPVR